MKKILVVLLVLASAVGVFALDGEWSVAGEAMVGAAIDFDAVGHADSYGTGWKEVYKGWGPMSGAFIVGYDLDGMRADLYFDARDVMDIRGRLNYTGENYGFQVQSNLYNQLLLQTPHWTGTTGVHRLWGWYSFLNDLVYIEAAYNSRETDFWTSDRTAAYYFTDGLPPNNANIGDWNGYTFTFIDHNQMLVADIRLTGLSFGVVINGLFNETPTANGFIDDVLKKMIFGLKFEMSPFEFAAQMKLDDYGIYFGGKVFFGPLTVGLSFMGQFPEATPTSRMVGAVSADYAQDLFGAGIKAWFGIDEATDTSQIGVEPTFYYNVIPTHLQFKTDFGFYFIDGGDSVKWMVQPALWWNFMGTGATSGFWGLGTGMIFRYRMVRDLTNQFDVSFKWSF